ncbi:superoxide dismutase family protein [Actinoplanes flavus]|uniref:Superoxide dismutase family protein n=1 Tax=Actinoplanes flavus TaxID=2820290 RepID=A0ABS3UE63_9ACTN|nr:superoxide dismutase family protein [Actinoplanes flavus]MBO3737076.1 superoxide dismutase family protein [Actinoplanes flavus]
MNGRLLILTAPLALSLLATPAANAAAPRFEYEGTFQRWHAGATAVTYQPALVPPGARATVTVEKTPAGVRVKLLATGLIPGRVYGAHLHTSPCGEDPAAAGPHYQHRPDPAAGPGRPSVDPAYANPRNEVWLDLTAGRNGVGRSVSAQEWTFDRKRAPWSLVLHAEHTHTGPGEAGTAGARLACLTRDALPAYGERSGR